MSARAAGLAGRFGVPALSVALAVTLLLGIAVAALRTPTASAATVLLRGQAVTAELADGTSRPLAEGDEVPRGAVVSAGRDGAVLRTRDRDTWLSGDAVVQVVDGARQELRAGFLLVDARRGPGVEVAAEAGVVSAPDGAVTRVEQGRQLRVGTYAGDPVTVRAAGRAADVEVGRSRQVQVPAGGLPGRVTPLVLTPGDPYERALAADLVAADEALVDLAGRLDAGGRPALLVRTAADTDAVPAELPAGAPDSERTLAYLLARAGGGSYGEVRSLRADGGSWGVVADLVDARVGDVAGLLDDLLGTPEAVLAAEEVDLPGLLTGPDPAPQTSGGDPVVAAPQPSAGGAAPTPTTGPGAPPPDDDPGPVPTPTGVVEAVVDTVLGLLPTTTTGSTITPQVPALPSDPVPTPTPAPTTGGLLDGLLTR